MSYFRDRVHWHGTGIELQGVSEGACFAHFVKQMQQRRAMHIIFVFLHTICYRSHNNLSDCHWLTTKFRYVLIMHTWKNEFYDFFLSDDDREIMLGHYFFFLEHLHRCMFFFIAVIFSNWYKIYLRSISNRDSDVISKSILVFWLATKFKYHFPLELLIFICASLIDPIAYFYTHLKPGTEYSFCNHQY